MRVIPNAAPYEGPGHRPRLRPDKRIVISGAHELELMEADRMAQGKFAG